MIDKPIDKTDKKLPSKDSKIPQTSYEDPVLERLYNFIPPSINPDNNIAFEERSNPLSSKGD